MSNHTDTDDGPPDTEAEETASEPGHSEEVAENGQPDADEEASHSDETAGEPEDVAGDQPHDEHGDQPAAGDEPDDGDELWPPTGPSHDEPTIADEDAFDSNPDHDRTRGNEPSDTEGTAGTIEELGSEVEVSAPVADDPDEDDLLGGLLIDSTEDVEIPDRLVDQVIGQEHARDVIIKAARQRRHVMMIGSPGTGKSMLAKAMTELLPKEELQDVLIYHNPDDGNKPKVRTVPAGKGEQIVDAHKEEARKRDQMRTFLMWIIIAVV